MHEVEADTWVVDLEHQTLRRSIRQFILHFAIDQVLILPLVKEQVDMVLWIEAGGCNIRENTASQHGFKLYPMDS